MVSNLNILGISGYAYTDEKAISMGAGKDTVARFIADSGFIQIALADPIKRLAMELWDFSEEQLWGPSELRNEPDRRYPLAKGKFLSPRDVLQKIGQAGRDIDRDVWVRKGIKTCRELLGRKDVYYDRTVGIVGSKPKVNRMNYGIIITDIRYTNEFQHVKKNGASIIRVKRKIEDIPNVDVTHDSETNMVNVEDSEFDFIINNDGSLNDLREAVSLFLSIK